METDRSAIEFAPRELFRQEFSYFLRSLHDFEKGELTEDQLRDGMESRRLNFSPEEGQLFRDTFDLFSMEKGLYPYDAYPEARDFILNRDNRDMTIDIGGPLAVGKSQFAKFLAPDIGAKIDEERFLPEDNSFVAPSFEDFGFTLRAQVRFLLNSVMAGLRGKYDEGRVVREASVFSDIHVFMEWRRLTGKVTDEEYKIYKDLVGILEPLIVKPNLFIAMIPDSTESLQAGLLDRIDGDPEVREMEKAVTWEDLEISIEAAKRMVPLLEEQGINVLTMVVDPREIYSGVEIKSASVYRVREALKILGEYLTKTPQVACDEAIRILANAHEPQLIFFHSQSMFTGKTATLNLISEKVGTERVLAFQPRAGIRPGWAEQEKNLVDRDGGLTPSVVIESDSIIGILEYVRRYKINPSEFGYLLIDEAMLFYVDADKATWALEELRKKGFNIICNGIDYTFKETPFTFSHEILEITRTRDSWSEIEMGTKCKYCSEEARGTRRILPSGEIAPYDNEDYQAGDDAYVAVCCGKHPSCVDRPKDFVREELPTGKRR